MRLYLGNCLDQMKLMADNSVDSICTDPPYGLRFMNKDWDYSVPSTEIWKECLRVLKPGGHLLAFGGTRTYHRLVVNIEDAGFEIRDQIMWIYSTGFPKSMDISKAIDKEAGATREQGEPKPYTNQNIKSGHLHAGHENEREQTFFTKPSTPEAQKWSGYGTALKPANEPICLARKPLSEKTVAKNVLKHGTGGLNVDASRISTTDNLNGGRYSDNKQGDDGYSYGAGINLRSKDDYVQPEGRFPANILFDEYAAGVLDEQTGELKGDSPNRKPRKNTAEAHNKTTSMGKASGDWETTGHTDNGGASRFFATFKQDTLCDQRDLSTAMLAGSSSKHDEKRLNSVQEAVRTSCSKDPLLSHCLDSIPDYKKCTLYQDLASLAETPESIDTTLIMRSLLKLFGSAHTATDESTKSAESEGRGNTEFAPTRFLYQAKASKKDRNQGLEDSGIVNNHATVKPIKLMEYLIKLVTPEGGIVLDPFMGSGTTGVAAQNLGFDFIGCEMDVNYFDICKARMGYNDLEDFF